MLKFMQQEADAEVSDSEEGGALGSPDQGSDGQVHGRHH